MKPPKKYIKWLQSHPAVWEALQEEWEPQVGDWCLNLHHGEGELDADYYRLGKLYIVIDYAPPDLVSLYEEDKRPQWTLHAPGPDTWIDTVYHDVEKVRQDFVWLPTLGQLVRMLRQVTEEREFDTALWETGFKLCHYLTKGAWAGELWHGTRTLEETDFCGEPEIARTALWAKVKGVEN